MLVKNVKVSDFMVLLSDIENVFNWFENVKSVILMECLSFLEIFVYIYFNLFWLVLDWDLVSYFCYCVLGEYKIEL